jgi:hypothetical protein
LAFLPRDWANFTYFQDEEKLALDGDAKRSCGILKAIGELSYSPIDVAPVNLLALLQFLPEMGWFLFI